jgi:ABC-type antimicrobial peptide transport system permease subunit
VRTTGNAAAIGSRVPAVVRELTPALAVSWKRSLRQQMQAALVTERLLATLSTMFGALALILAATGVYGVIAFDVARRTREIGIRVALGAQRRRVLGAVLGQVAFMVLPGIAAGVGASLFASTVVETLLFGIAPQDATTLLMAATTLAVVGFVAASIPARRAASVDPAVALRGE